MRSPVNSLSCRERISFHPGGLEASKQTDAPGFLRVRAQVRGRRSSGGIRHGGRGPGARRRDPDRDLLELVGDATVEAEL